MFKKIIVSLLSSLAVTAFAVPLSSQHALVFEEDSGKVLLEKNAHSIVPIASLTKLMTAMVVLDANLDMSEKITVEESDVDTIKFSSSRVPVGVVLSRGALLELALMSSDNRAAAALARTYPGGKPAFLRAVGEKLIALDMRDTTIEEPTGLSPHNRSSAADLVKMVTAASRYSEISRLSTGTDDLIEMNGRAVQYRNTNRLVGRDGWDILLSKTGFTREAGRCLVMRMQTAGKHVIVVLLNASETAARVMDAENVHRFIKGEPTYTAVVRHGPRMVAKSRGGSRSLMLVKAGGVAKAVKSKGGSKPARKKYRAR